MNLTGKELAALMYVARQVINIDGEVAEAEQNVFVNVFSKFGLDNEQVGILVKLSYECTPEQALQTLINLGPEQKRFASALVTVLVCADGKLTEDEKELYSNLLAACKLPYLTVEEAVAVLQ